MPRSPANYTEAEIRALIEHYEIMREAVDTHPRKLGWLALRADLDAVLARLPLKYWEVVLLHGLIGFDQNATAQLLQISQSAVSKRFRKGVEELHYYINGGT